MSEILFRGKTKKSGTWVEGFYTKQGDIDMIMSDFEMSGDSNPANVSFDFYRVIPETVGQFTGKQDNHGADIYKGDIVEFSYCNNVHKAEIVYNIKTCGFEVRYATVVGAYGERAVHSLNFANIENIKVIGNIHDNPERIS